VLNSKLITSIIFLYNVDLASL